MKVTFLLPPVNFSGGIRVVAIYAKWLQDAGHDVTLISVLPARPSIRESFKALIKEGKWPRSEAPSSHLDGLGLNHRILPPGLTPTDADVPDGDVVIATWWETAEWAARLSPSKGRKVYFIQHHELFDFVPADRCEATYRLPFQQIAVAQWLADVMRTRYGNPNCAVVPNAVDHDVFYPETLGQARPLTVGTLFSSASFKASDTACEILKALKKKYPSLKVVMLGSAKPPEGLIAELGAEMFFSPSQDQIRAIYNRCRLWLTTSHSEGFNLMAMEAMACGTPVVSTRTGWPIEAVKSGVNGELIDIDSLEQGVTACDKLLRLSTQDWLAVSRGAHATVAHLCWERTAVQFEALLTAALPVQPNGHDQLSASSTS